jgi:hypothetical protein
LAEGLNARIANREVEVKKHVRPSVTKEGMLLTMYVPLLACHVVPVNAFSLNI